MTLELRDYSTLQGSYDKIASIGMFEHVGIVNHSAYFAAIARLLKPGGLYLHHAIVRRAKRTDKDLRKRSREYQALIRYIFPGAEVDHIGMSIANLERHGFEVRDVEGWREHYRQTCKAWHERLLANNAQAEREVGSVRTRLWLAYLAGCAYRLRRLVDGHLSDPGGRSANAACPACRRPAPIFIADQARSAPSAAHQLDETGEAGGDER